jgi:MoxR-like ATPase
MRSELTPILEQINRVILGKEAQVRLSLACLLARGHLLITDIPGVGKTTLAHTLAKSLGLDYKRIQFTSDLLPTDILGAAVFERDSGRFRFQPGPIFSQVILADEINRASPKAQSAMLEAMEEEQVSVEGETRHLPQPFFVIATQNPVEQIGVFPLPESQLDRFMMRISLGYPNPRAERDLLAGQDRRDLLDDLHAAMKPATLIELQRRVREVHVSDALLDYLQAIIAASRQNSQFEEGLSPRGGLALKHAAQSWAYIGGRDHVEPEDVQAVLPSTVAHRLRPAAGVTPSDEAWAARILGQVPIP